MNPTHTALIDTLSHRGVELPERFLRAHLDLHLDPDEDIVASLPLAGTAQPPVATAPVFVVDLLAVTPLRLLLVRASTDHDRVEFDMGSVPLSAISSLTTSFPLVGGSFTLHLASPLLGRTTLHHTGHEDVFPQPDDTTFLRTLRRMRDRRA